MKSKGLKNLLFVFLFLISSTSFGIGFAEAEQLQKDKRVTQGKVVRWADSVFYFHEDYRFENFHVHYTDEFYIVMLRSDQYKKKVDDLLAAKKNKTYERSAEDYNKELSAVIGKYKRFQIIVESFESRIKYIEVLFWSNIKTKHGYPVYYSHRFKLSNDYYIMAALIKSSIGNKSSDNKIIYN